MKPIAVSLLALLTACGADEVTSVRILVSYEPTVALQTATVTARDLEQTSQMQPELVLLLPDEWAGEELLLDLVGTGSGVPTLRGSVTVVPRLHAEVQATVALSGSTPGSCTIGDVRCESDGVSTCTSADGTASWSAPTPCPSERPFCSAGVCQTDCVDECSAGQTRCEGSGATQACGDNDADTCRDWLMPVACASGTCVAGMCEDEPPTSHWTAMSTIGEPSPRSNHTAVWTGSEMIVWGGWDGAASLGTGGRYDPTTNTWTPTSTVNAPTARHSHTAVWTGAEMIVWGGSAVGEGEEPALASGGRYDPITDRWTPMSEEAVRGRRSHQAIWTGSEMLVYSGYPDDGAFAHIQGDRYEPSLDRWSSVSRTDFPQHAWAGGFVWTGTEAIAWGIPSPLWPPGTPGFSGRYDPRNDRWTSMSIVGEPDLFETWTAVAVWTGSRMLVWGPADWETEAVDGGSYDPVSDRWSAISTVGQPAYRLDHSATWTGSELIIWGGATRTHPIRAVHTGAAYEPGADRWRPLPTEGSPEGRVFHTSVWTGSEMLIWGGVGYPLDRLGAGFRYRP